jgi:hypothetical protein
MQKAKDTAMAITVEWLNAGETILYWQFSAVWTWDDFYAAAQRSQQLITSKPHDVYTIVDLLLVRQLPQGLYTHAAHVLMQRPDNNTLAVILLPNTSLQKIFKTFMAFYHAVYPHQTQRLILAEDREAALQQIAQLQQVRFRSS